MHRDPETGQFRSHDDEPVDVNYSDHEFLNFRVNEEFGGGANSNFGVEYEVENDVLDLENDELAMLSWLNCTLSVDVPNFAEAGIDVTKGSISANAEIGANLSGDEFISQAGDPSGLEKVDDEGPAATAGAKASDDPGLWAHLNASAQSGYKDTDADGNFSGNPVNDNDRMRRVFSQETRGGPYIDNTDDVSIGIYVNQRNAEGRVRTVIYGQMAFIVMEYENRRQEFAPYDPGR